MAQYWEDFSADTLGAAPASFAAPAGFGLPPGAFVVEEDAAGPAGRRLRIQGDATRRVAKFLPVDADAARDNVDLRVLANIVSYTSNLQAFGLIARGSGSGATDMQHVGLEVQRVNSTIHRWIAADRTGATPTALGTSADNPTPFGTLYWWRLRVNADESVQLYRAPANDPTAETLIASGTTTNTALGWVGLYAGGTTPVMHIYAVGVGTGGDAAPYEAPAASVTADFSGGFGVRGAVSADFNGGFSVEADGVVQADFSGGFAVRGAVVADFSGGFEVQGETPAGIRLRPGLKYERGAVAAGRTGVRWCVFADASLSAVVASGGGLTLDGEGRAVIDVAGSSFAVGDWVPMMLTVFDAAVNPWDQYIQSGFGWVLAEAAP